MDFGFENGQCSNCNTNSASVPFYFKIGKQKVMVITACPSYQTATRPLTSVRFLRQLLYSLFGIKGISEDGLKYLFEDSKVYWTSANKCYYSGFFDQNKVIGLYDFCARKYLKKELEFLRDSLQLIIIIGEKTNKICRPIINEFISEFKEKTCKTIEFIAVDYLHEEREINKYYEIRKRLGSIFTHSRFDFSEAIEIDDIRSSRTGPIVHIATEKKALDIELRSYGINDNGILESKQPNSDCKVDNLWAENVIVPLKRFYSAYVSIWTMIESSITSFLLNEFNPSTPRYQVLSMNEILCRIKSKGAKENLPSRIHSEREIKEIISEKWLYCLDKYIEIRNRVNNSKYHISSDLFYTWKKIKEKVYTYKAIRNLIVHSGGFIFQSELNQVNSNQFYDLNNRIAKAKIIGAKIRTNTLFLTKGSIICIRDFYNGIADFLVKLDKEIRQLER